MSKFYESELSAKEWLEENIGLIPQDIDPEEYDPETDLIVDEASKDALKKHDKGYYADGSKIQKNKNKDGSIKKKRKVRSTSKHKSTSSEKAKRKKQDKERDRKTTWRK